MSQRLVRISCRKVCSRSNSPSPSHCILIKIIMSNTRLLKNVIIKKKTIVPANPPPEPTKPVLPVESKKPLPPGFSDLSFFPVNLLHSPTKVCSFSFLDVFTQIVTIQGRYVVSAIQAEPFKNIMFSRRYATSLYRRCLFQYCSNCHKRLKDEQCKSYSFVSLFHTFSFSLNSLCLKFFSFFICLMMLNFAHFFVYFCNRNLSYFK